LSETDCLLGLLPFSFDVGLNQLLSCFLAGAHLVILNSWFPRDILKAVGLARITGISSVPSIWVDIISYPKGSSFGHDTQSLRYITVSGGDLSRKQLVKLKRFFVNTDIYKTYGQTETFRSGILKPHSFSENMLSVGKPPRGTQVFILDPEAAIAPPGAEGEIVHSGVGTMIGYMNDPIQTHKKLREIPPSITNLIKADKVVFTGDRGKIDKAGYLYVIGRTDRMIKTSGYRVYPNEVENAILEWAGVKHAAVVGIKNSRLGQAIVAEIVLDDSHSKEQLNSFLKRRLPSYMLPTQINTVPSLPRTVNGKIDYERIRNRYERNSVL
jgi:acyl-CoA synthetase (AMP-forming)/AMP-acid ligase II